MKPLPEFTKLSENYLKWLVSVGYVAVVDADGKSHSLETLLKSELFPVKIKQPVDYQKRVN